MKDFVPTTEDLQWMTERLNAMSEGNRWFTHTAHYQKIGDSTLHCVQAIDEVNKDFGDRVMVEREIAKVRTCVEAVGWTFKDTRITNN